MSPTRQLRRASVLAAALIVVVATGCGGSGETTAPAPPPADAGTFIGTPAGKGPALDFTLHDARGERVTLSAERGRLVLLTFLYTSCRDVCPLIAERLNTVLGRLGPQRDDVRVVAVSVDPGRDTPEAIEDFEARHRLRPEFHYVTGTPLELTQVWQNYNVLALERNEDVIDHSAPTILIDRAGRARLIYDAQADPADILHDVRLLLDARTEG